MWFVTMLYIYGVEGAVAAVDLAAVQRRLPHGVSRHLGAPVERAHRRRVDADPFRPRPRRGAGLHQRGGLCAGQRGGFPQLRLPAAWASSPSRSSPGTGARTPTRLVIMLVTGLYCVVGGMYSRGAERRHPVRPDPAWRRSSSRWWPWRRPRPTRCSARCRPAGTTCSSAGSWTWTGRSSCPSLQERIYGAGGDGYSVFGFFICMLFLKGVLVSMAGPTPNYAIQHILSTRSPREAALENMVMAWCRWRRGSC